MKSFKITILLFVAVFFSANAQNSWQSNGSNIYYSAGKVGIGTSTPAYNFDVNGNSKIIEIASAFSWEKTAENYFNLLNR